MRGRRVVSVHFTGVLLDVFCPLLREWNSFPAALDDTDNNNTSSTSYTSMSSPYSRL